MVLNAWAYFIELDIAEDVHVFIQEHDDVFERSKQLVSWSDE